VIFYSLLVFETQHTQTNIIYMITRPSDSIRRAFSWGQRCMILAVAWAGYSDLQPTMAIEILATAMPTTMAIGVLSVTGYY